MFRSSTAKGIYSPPVFALAGRRTNSFYPRTDSVLRASFYLNPCGLVKEKLYGTFSPREHLPCRVYRVPKFGSSSQSQEGKSFFVPGLVFQLTTLINSSDEKCNVKKKILVDKSTQSCFELFSASKL